MCGRLLSWVATVVFDHIIAMCFTADVMGEIMSTVLDLDVRFDDDNWSLRTYSTGLLPPLEMYLDALQIRVT